MADTADIASDIEQERLSRILANRPKPTPRPSSMECEECGDPIPEDRRTALPGVITCINCQSLNEDAAKWRQ